MKFQESICCQGNGMKKENMKFIGGMFYDGLIDYFFTCLHLRAPQYYDFYFFSLSVEGLT